MPRIACSKVKHSEHSRPQTCLQRLRFFRTVPEDCHEISSVTVEQRRSGDSVAALLLQAPITCDWHITSANRSRRCQLSHLAWSRTEDSSEDLGQSAVWLLAEAARGLGVAGFQSLITVDSDWKRGYVGLFDGALGG